MPKKQTLLEMRKESGLSTTEIAHRVGSSYPTLLNWEKGKAVPSAVSMKKLLEVYGKTNDDLDWTIFGEENTSTKTNTETKKPK